MAPSNAYIIEVLTTINILSVIAMPLSLLSLAFIFGVLYDSCVNDEIKKSLRKLFVLLLIVFIVSLLAIIFIPPKETLILLYGGK